MVLHSDFSTAGNDCAKGAFVSRTRGAADSNKGRLKNGAIEPATFGYAFDHCPLRQRLSTDKGHARPFLRVAMGHNGAYVDFEVVSYLAIVWVPD